MLPDIVKSPENSAEKIGTEEISIEETGIEEIGTSDSDEGDYELGEAVALPVVVSVLAERAGMRLDVFVAEKLDNASRSEAQRLIALEVRGEEGGVRVNGKLERASYRVRVGDEVVICRPRTVEIEAQPEDIPITVLFEDEDLLVIDKARGMVVHPAPGATHGTLVNAVLFHAQQLSGIGGTLRPGIVHRLDKDTGGLILVAKNDVAHRSLQAQIQARTATRRYLALIWGIPSFQQATVDAPIGRHPTDRKKMAVVTDPRYTSRSAVTEFTALELFNSTFALVEAKLQTGRTHQIRVHCAYIQHPVVGDPTYGGRRELPEKSYPLPIRTKLRAAIAGLNGQALHAYALGFSHPRTGERLEFTVPLPPAMQGLLTILRAE